MLKTVEMVEEHPGPVQDALFLSLSSILERCELKNGWACEKCSRFKVCNRIFNKLCEMSSKGRLNSDDAREFIETLDTIVHP